VIIGDKAAPYIVVSRHITDAKHIQRLTGMSSSAFAKQFRRVILSEDPAQAKVEAFSIEEECDEQQLIIVGHAAASAFGVGGEFFEWKSLAWRARGMIIGYTFAIAPSFHHATWWQQSDNVTDASSFWLNCS
jgi:hypothetical protein